jgi:hypothetical protein
MFRRKYSSMEVGGGVPGKDVGTDPDTMTEAGVITGECQVFTDIFMLVGEMISDIIDGEGNRGNITGCITMIFVTIGVTGKEPSTGTVADLVIPVADLVGGVETAGMETVVGAAVVVAVPAAVVVIAVRVEDMVVETVTAAVAMIEDKAAKCKIAA